MKNSVTQPYYKTISCFANFFQAKFPLEDFKPKPISKDNFLILQRKVLVVTFQTNLQPVTLPNKRCLGILGAIKSNLQENFPYVHLMQLRGDKRVSWLTNLIQK